MNVIVTLKNKNIRIFQKFYRSEHERHAPTCPFVRGEYTQNVPLSVNYATAPAITLNDRVSFGTSSLSDVFSTFSKKGVVTLYNYSRVLKVSDCFVI